MDARLRRRRPARRAATPRSCIPGGDPGASGGGGVRRVLLSPTAIAFDLDGTLVDSRRDLATAVNRVRDERGLPGLPLDQVTGWIGDGARSLVRRALDLEGRALDRALADFLGHYGEVCLDTTEPYAGVPELLAALAGRFPLALVTNKPEAMSRRILEHHGLAGRFRALLGGDTLPVRKPDPAPLRHAAFQMGAAVKDLLMVGDSAIDAETARRAGAAFAFASWGYARAAEAIAADLRLVRPADLGVALGVA